MQREDESHELHVLAAITQIHKHAQSCVPVWHPQTQAVLSMLQLLLFAAFLMRRNLFSFCWILLLLLFFPVSAHLILFGHARDRLSVSMSFCPVIVPVSFLLRSGRRDFVYWHLPGIPSCFIHYSISFYLACILYLCVGVTDQASTGKDSSFFLLRIPFSCCLLIRLDLEGRSCFHYFTLLHRTHTAAYEMQSDFATHRACSGWEGRERERKCATGTLSHIALALAQQRMDKCGESRWWSKLLVAAGRKEAACLTVCVVDACDATSVSSLSFQSNWPIARLSITEWSSGTIFLPLSPWCCSSKLLYSFTPFASVDVFFLLLFHFKTRRPKGSERRSLVDERCFFFFFEVLMLVPSLTSSVVLFPSLCYVRSIW